MKSAPSSSKTNLVAGAAALVVMALAFLVFNSGSSTTEAIDANPPESTLAEAIDPPDTIVSFSDLPVVSVDDLPIEAIETLLLIDDGGPYPYRQDDGTFQNREGILPDHDRQHYREYTVDTPGSPDRGARRIVTGADGERYYTDDHYDSFREILG